MGLDNATNHHKPDGSSPITYATSAAGNATSGLLNTVGGIVGAAGRGVGQTVEGVAGSAGEPVSRAVEGLTGGVERGAAAQCDREGGRPDAPRGQDCVWGRRMNLGV